ncbi:unnamed protein product [Triticum turgidum subsp. durum]|uniref:Isopenicillin N synthase-like Fe(2+) 2OG dioxygenase domain-containing protein n=1 Tax=Triticum turgidum subsp. durum TaxID=4567 RepID=A0A9R1BV59_TRITD|nr:unnamed protein product [Triticum turgidum subsp. durum]
MSNDRFKSVEHRVLAKTSGPRLSVACFFGTPGAVASKIVLRPIVGAVQEHDGGGAAAGVQGQGPRRHLCAPPLQALIESLIICFVFSICE